MTPDALPQEQPMSDRWQQLRELAEAATPGPWEVAGPWPTCHIGVPDATLDDPSTGYRYFDPICQMVEATPTSDVQTHPDGAFIAAANPSAVREILAERDELLAALTELRKLIVVIERAHPALVGKARYDIAAAERLAGDKTE